MMNIFDKIYAYENFGIILYVIIGILILLFITVLFLGLSDKKKEAKKATKKTEEEDAFLRVDDTVKLDVIKEDTIPEVKEEKKIVIKKPQVNLDSLLGKKSNVVEESDDDFEANLPKMKEK